MNTAFNMFYIGLLSLLFIRCGGPSCIKEVRFELPISIVPEKESYSVGDTIWVSMNLPEELTDQLSGEMISIGRYPFETGMNIIKLEDSTWSNGTYEIELIESIGEVNIFGFSFPEIVPIFDFNEDLQEQRWRFGLVPKVPGSDYVLIFQKRNPFGWSGTIQFDNNNCDYYIGKSIYLTNQGVIDYQYYVEKYPHFTETGNDGNLAENHRAYGAFFFSVE